MKFVLVGITLLVATIAIGVGCGPKEKYCYADKETCAAKDAEVWADMAWKPEPDAEASAGTCFNSSGDPVPCTGG